MPRSNSVMVTATVMYFLICLGGCLLLPVALILFLGPWSLTQFMNLSDSIKKHRLYTNERRGL